MKSGGNIFGDEFFSPKGEYVLELQQRPLAESAVRRPGATDLTLARQVGDILAVATHAINQEPDMVNLIQRVKRFGKTPAILQDKLRDLDIHPEKNKAEIFAQDQTRAPKAGVPAYTAPETSRLVPPDGGSLLVLPADVGVGFAELAAFNRSAVAGGPLPGGFTAKLTISKDTRTR